MGAAIAAALLALCLAAPAAARPDLPTRTLAHCSGWTTDPLGLEPGLRELGWAGVPRSQMGAVLALLSDGAAVVFAETAAAPVDWPVAAQRGREIAQRGLVTAARERHVNAYYFWTPFGGAALLTIETIVGGVPIRRCIYAGHTDFEQRAWRPARRADGTREPSNVDRHLHRIETRDTGPDPEGRGRLRRTTAMLAHYLTDAREVFGRPTDVSLAFSTVTTLTE